MRVVVVTAPTPFVGLSLAKAHLKVDFSDDDALITNLIAAACAELDGPGGWLGRAIGAQTLELQLDAFPCAQGGYALPFPPAVSLTSVTYPDPATGADVVLGAGARLVGDMLLPTYGQGWPSARHDANAVRVRYQAGGGAIDPRITSAVLLRVQDLYDNRSASVIEAGRVGVVENPTYDRLLAPLRIFR